MQRYRNRLYSTCSATGLIFRRLRRQALAAVTVPARVVAATNRDLRHEAAEGYKTVMFGFVLPLTAMVLVMATVRFWRKDSRESDVDVL